MDNQIDTNAETSIRTHIDPVEYGLNPSFRFVNVKVHEINFQDSVLSGFNDDFNRGHLLPESSSSITAVIDDPFIMGRIACVSILNNLYGSGITDCDNIQLNLKFSEILNETERDVIVQLMYNGFKETAKNARISVREPLITVREPLTLDPYWCDIGWVATRVPNQDQYFLADDAVEGDMLVLTKPLGTQVAISAYQWIGKPEQWNRIKSVVSKKQIREAYTRAIKSMAHSNRAAAKLMRKYKAHCSTHISYLGLLEHAKAMAKRQKNKVSFAIVNLPIIENMAAISKVCKKEFKLADGKCPEISGGLLVCLPKKKAVAYRKHISKITGRQAWIIGIVENGNRTAFITEKARIIEEPEI